MLLLDTNIVSFQFRGDSWMAQYSGALAGEVQAIAFVTLAEIYKWPIERNFSHTRRVALEKHVGSFVPPSHRLQTRQTLGGNGG